MRYLYLLLLSALLSTPFASHAQMSGSDSLRQRLNFIFAPLDKSQVPTAYLAEYGVRLLPLRHYDGTALTDTDRTEIPPCATCAPACARPASAARIHCPMCPCAFWPLALA